MQVLETSVTVRLVRRGWSAASRLALGLWQVVGGSWSHGPKWLGVCLLAGAVINGVLVWWFARPSCHPWGWVSRIAIGLIGLFLLVNPLPWRQIARGSLFLSLGKPR